MIEMLTQSIYPKFAVKLSECDSEFQLRDVKNLLVSGYDAEYLERWTRQMELNDLLQECLI